MPCRRRLDKTYRNYNHATDARARAGAPTLARSEVRLRHLACQFALACIRVFQLQLPLLDHAVQFFRLAAELHALLLDELQLGAVNLDEARVQLLLKTRHQRAKYCFEKCTLKRRLQLFGVIFSRLQFFPGTLKLIRQHLFIRKDHLVLRSKDFIRKGVQCIVCFGSPLRGA